jgi:hypothetical protein
MSTRFTMAPRASRKAGAAACARKKGAFAFEANKASQSASVAQPSGVGWKAEALLSRASRRPNRASVAVTRSGRPAVSANSACNSRVLSLRCASSSSRNAVISRVEAR